MLCCMLSADNVKLNLAHEIVFDLIGNESKTTHQFIVVHNLFLTFGLQVTNYITLGERIINHS